jgi:DNA-binding protein H-NS
MATLEQIQARMKKLQAQADALIAKKAQAAVDQIRSLMLKHGLTTEDIEARAKARREAKAATGRVGIRRPKSVGARKGKLPPKYLNPKTGETWSGHARPPAWIKNVRDRTKFLIAGAAEGALAANGSGAVKAKPAAKKAAGKKAAVRKTAAKKAAVTKKVAGKKAASVKTPARKGAARKAVTKKAASASRSATARKVSRKRAAVKAPAAVESGASSAA